MTDHREKLSDMNTHVFIDVSNIRSAALGSCKIKIDFTKLIKYFKEKYPNLKSVLYFEGISSGDNEHKEQFRRYRKLGYEIRSLERKLYFDPARYKNFTCKECKTTNRVQIRKRAGKLKSNVDVFIATEVLEVAHAATKPTHIILMSCDGDYAEMIRSACKNRDVHVTVLATPTVKKNNALSIRLKQLTKELSRDQYELVDITSIKQKIS
ncbi:MAG: NYN domain-containing protein [Candidatus Nomurabacteria bacterium]|jgi:uncharacterized LabA/DUF88 family protein|nr:NYN domain-containing protein [Candidatus Nomurabacteria bacterium]